MDDGRSMRTVKNNLPTPSGGLWGIRRALLDMRKEGQFVALLRKG